MPDENLENLPDDGLTTPEVGMWAIEKYRHVTLYASMFAKSMSKKWDCLVYLDLYSGAGKAKIKGKNRIIKASPLLVLDQEHKFDQYIFNDSKPANCKALDERRKSINFDGKVTIFCEDVNVGIDKILTAMPRAHKDFKVLTFCFLDPFKLDNLKFTTLKKLSVKYMDFLVLIPSDMDGNRNLKYYLPKDSTIVEEFIGNPDWREAWKTRKDGQITFGQFIVEEFCQSMGRLDFIVPDLKKTVGIKNSKNRVLYRLALFSKSKLAEKFWRESMKYSNPQTDFGF